MEITVLETAGKASAIAGLGLSFGKPIVDEADFQARALRILDRQSASEAKFLRQMVVWLKVKAPRYWWQEASTYRFGVETQSASTMHTLMKRPLAPTDFAGQIPPATLNDLNVLVAEKRWYAAKQLLPESFLQERVVSVSYQALRAMYRDRHDHRLPEWRSFCDFISSGRLPDAHLVTHATL